MIKNQDFHSDHSGSILHARKPGQNKPKPGSSIWREVATCLQQGKFVADVLYFYGENTNLTWRFKEKLPDIPGYEFDFCNSSALINVMQVKNGKIVTPSGMSYSLLVLDESAKYMTLPVLKKIRDMVKAGAKVAGIKPERSPSLSDNDAEFQAIVNEVWGNNNPNVSVSQNYSDILKGSNIPEDVIIKNAKAKILYVHRSETLRNRIFIG